MENKKQQKRVLKKKVKKSFIEKNLKTMAIIFLVLFLGQSIRGCVNTSSLDRELKTQSYENDSINIIKNNKISEQDSTIEAKKDFIQYLEYELKIAGVKVQAADERAKAIQSTAEKVKNNTTTTIKIQADTTKNKIINTDTIK